LLFSRMFSELSPGKQVERFRQLTGLDLADIEVFSLRVGVSWEKCADAILILKLGCSAEQLAALSFRGVSERQLRRDFVEVGEAVEAKWGSLVDPTVRFSHTWWGMPFVTCAVDGTVVPCRATGGERITQTGKRTIQNFSGKYRIRCKKFEVWVTMYGVPFAFRGLIFGAEHDVWFWEHTVFPFPHKENELFLGDSGYFGWQHFLLPFKKNEAAGAVVLRQVGGKDLTVRRYWNKCHSKWRSRVERLFAFIDGWAFSRNCQHGDTWLKLAYGILVAFLHGLMLAKPNSYDEHLGGAENWAGSVRCAPCEKADRTELAELYGKRTLYARALFNSGYLPTAKNSAHRAKTAPPTKGETWEDIFGPESSSDSE
jgi:hypothetical protein